jgi:ELWxxDGT repeat protein
MLVKGSSPDWLGYPMHLTAMGGALYLLPRPVAQRRTEAGTTPIVDLDAGGDLSGIGQIAVSGGRLFFSTTEGEDLTARTTTLWVSDGTATGSSRVMAFDAGDSLFSLGNMIDVNGTLFFAHYRNGLELEVWRSDGTPGGTKRLIGFKAKDDYIELISLLNVNGTAFFSIYDNEEGSSIWKSDGTSDGTRRVTVDASPWYLQPLASIGDTVYFVTDADEASVLWKVHRTASSATRVKSVVSYARQLTPVHNTLFFIGEVGDGRYELWKSTGTSRGTMRVRSFDSPLQELAAIQGRLLFSAGEPKSGRELYRVNAGGGAFRVANIAPGADSSWP